ncbi:hypothetical protein RBB50_002369 [Rhinocladiella similis]
MAITGLSLIYLLILSWVSLRAFRLTRNYLEARKLGVPIIIIPVSKEDRWWIVVWGKFAWIQHVPVIGYWLPYSHHAWSLNERYRPHHKYGDAFVIVSPTMNELVINDPQVGSEIQAQYKSWYKPNTLYDIFDIFGPCMITANGEDWQRHRRIVNPAFREQNHKLVWEESLRQASQMLDVVGRRPSTSLTLLDVRNNAAIIAMHVLSGAGFGHGHDFEGGLQDVPAGHTRSLADTLLYLLNNLLYFIVFMYWGWLGYLGPGKYKEVMGVAAEFRRYMKEVIAYNRATTQGGGGGQNADIVSALVEADEAAKREEKTMGAPGGRSTHLTDEELFGNLFLFNVAGYETTSNAITYTIPYLAANRGVQDWVGQEVDAVFNNHETLKYEEVFPLLVRVLAVMYETLRLWGPATDVARWASSNDEILRINGEETVIPKRMYVSTNLYGIHSDPRWWGDDSLEWRPQRWVQVDPKTGKESIAPPPKGAAYLAWSAGPRVCPGRKFSQVEFVAVVSTILRRYRLDPMIIEGKMRTKEEAREALLKEIGDSGYVVTPRFRNPESAGVVFVER